MRRNRGPSGQEKLAAFAEDLIAVANDALVIDLLIPTEAEALAFWRDQLSRSSKGLKDIFAACGNASDGELNLNVALTAAFMIGSRVSDSPINARLIRAGAAHATRVRKAKSDVIDEVIFGLGLPVWTRHSKRNDNWIAGKISDEVNQKLKEKDFRILQVDAIRKRVKRLRTNGRPSG